MAGRNRPKDGVASLAYVPAIQVLLWKKKDGMPSPRVYTWARRRQDPVLGVTARQYVL